MASDESKKPADGKKDEPEIKVTDRRMFTSDGELREEYREAAEKGVEPVEKAVEGDEASSRSGPSAAAADTPILGAGSQTPGSGAGERGATVEIPSTDPGPAPSFLDLVGLLAEPVPLYLGDAELPDGRTVENLDAARLHIDLLDVLRRKTAGNLTSQETAVLEDVIYQLRMRYVQKRG